MKELSKIREMMETEEEKTLREAKNKVVGEVNKTLAKDIATTFSTGHGQRTLKWLMDLCGYQKASLVVNPQTGEINLASTAHNEAMRNIYLKIRARVPTSSLIAVENRGSELEDIFD